MNRLSDEKRAAILSAFFEGVSNRGISRMTGVAKNTVARLIVSMGEVCQRHHDSIVRGVNCTDIQCDEIWSYCYAKDKNAPRKAFKYGEAGKTWTWLALDRESKLIISWLTGRRDGVDAGRFISDLSNRLNRPEVAVTTDGNGTYRAPLAKFMPEATHQVTAAIEWVPRGNQNCALYSGAPRIGPRGEGVTTAHVERVNLTIRTSMSRFARSSNAFSKKIEHHRKAIALFLTFYNFSRVHKTLGVTPAMAAGIAIAPWALKDLVLLLEGGDDLRIRQTTAGATTG